MNARRAANYESGNQGAGLRIGIVVARFNEEIGEGLLASCRARLGKLGVLDGDISVYSVPGALEVPLALQKLANTGFYHALIALGAVIRGETYHFEIVSNESAGGITTVQLDTGVPIANGILTTENEGQARARVEEKGADCAAVAVEMVALLRAIDQQVR
jgi:6,7-dimethyl-8-ribityllumazine synthase